MVSAGTGTASTRSVRADVVAGGLLVPSRDGAMMLSAGSPCCGLPLRFDRIRTGLMPVAAGKSSTRSCRAPSHRRLPSAHPRRTAPLRRTRWRAAGRAPQDVWIGSVADFAAFWSARAALDARRRADRRWPARARPATARCPADPGAAVPRRAGEHRGRDHRAAAGGDGRRIAGAGVQRRGGGRYRALAREAKPEESAAPAARWRRARPISVAVASTGRPAGAEPARATGPGPAGSVDELPTRRSRCPWRPR